MSQYKDSSNSSQQSSSPEILNDQEAIFKLIDSVVSLEFCLHYQVLPLELDGNYLTVGMINTKDKTSLNFIRPIAASLNYSLEIQSITAQEHQLALAAYLKRSIPPVPNNQNNQRNKTKKTRQDRSLDKETMIDEQMSQPSPGSLDASVTLHEESGQKQKAPSPRSSNNLHERPTLIVDSETNTEDNQLQQSQIISSEPQIHQLQSVSEVEGVPETIAVPIGESSPKSVSTPILELEARHAKVSIENLAALEPRQLWQELLAKILDGGIGRLYLERYPKYGRIIWSRDGVIQSSLDKVKLNVFEQIIREIKTLGKQSLSPLRKPKKVAIERIYNQERILLRLEFLVGKSGDEITIQVLRGEALAFYEQRQVAKSVEQAIYFAEKMEKTLRKIRMCANEQNLGDFGRLEAIYKQIDRQFQLIKKQNNPQK